MKGQENKEDTAKILEGLSRRINFSESKKNAIVGMKMTNCILEKGCYVAKNMGSCPCEL